MADAI